MLWTGNVVLRRRFVSADGRCFVFSLQWTMRANSQANHLLVAMLQCCGAYDSCFVLRTRPRRLPSALYLSFRCLAWCALLFPARGQAMYAVCTKYFVAVCYPAPWHPRCSASAVAFWASHPPADGMHFSHRPFCWNLD